MKRRTNISDLLRLISLVGVLMMLSIASSFGQAANYAWGSGIFGGYVGKIDQVAIATDPSNNVISLGYFSDSLAPGVSTNNVTVRGGQYITKYNQSGSILWTTTISNFGIASIIQTVHPLDVAVDSSSNIYVLGYSDTNIVNHGKAAYYLLKYTPSGTLIHSTFWDNKTVYKKGNCAVDGYGNVVVSLAFQDSLVLPSRRMYTTNALHYAFAVICVDSNGVIGGGRLFGGKKPWINDLTCNSNSSYTYMLPYSAPAVYIVGSYDSLKVDTAYYGGTQNDANGFVALMLLGSSINSYHTLYVAKLTLPIGSNPHYIEPTTVAIDKANCIFIAGQFTGSYISTDAFGSNHGNDTLRSIAVNDTDIFYAYLDSTYWFATISYLKSVSSVGHDYARSIIPRTDSSILLSGQLAVGGSVVIGPNHVIQGGFMMGVNYTPTSPINSAPHYQPSYGLQQTSPASCSTICLARSRNGSIYSAGGISNYSLFGSSTISNVFNNPNGIGYTAKFSATNPCTLVTNINGTDTTLMCQNVSPINTTASGGSGNYTYSWLPAAKLNGANQATVTIAKQMDMEKLSVRVTDNSTGCTANDTIVVGAYLVHNDTLFSCQGASVTLDMGAGASQYNWLNTTPTLTTQTRTVNTAGTYFGTAGYYHPYSSCGTLTNRYVVLDTCPCTLTASITLNPISCYGTNTGGAIVTASGGTGNYTYTWNTTPAIHSAIATGLVAGTYTVTISDSNGCSTTKTITLTQPLPLTINTSATPVSNCIGANNGSAQAIVSGGITVYTYHWNTTPVQTTPTATGLGVGVYNVTATDAHGCTVAAPVTITQVSLTSFLQDTVLSCQHAAVIAVSVGNGSAHYRYDWIPASMIGGANMNGPTVVVSNQHDMDKLKVTVYDSVTGCTVRDSVVVGVYLAHFDTISMCNHQPITLDMGAGASRYEWNGNFGDSVELHVADSAGHYYGIAFYNRPYSNCGALTSMFTVIDSCTPVPDLVWPGDANSNGVADLYDVLNIGIGYGNTGPVRTSASSVWVGQPATDWQLQFLNNVNLKHADCDGNGAIDSLDVDVVSHNYGLTHAKAEEAQANPTNPDLYVQFTIDSATNLNLVTANVFLGRVSHPVSNGYGLAYSLFYDPTIVDTNVMVSYAGSWLGQNDYPVHLVKNQHINGKVDLAYSRTNHTNVNGYGQVAAISFYIQDNIIGKQQDLIKQLALQISGAKLVSSDGTEEDINVQNDTMIVYQGINDNVNGTVQVEVYPNPSDGVFYLSLKGNDAIKTVTMVNALGQTILSKQYTQHSNIYQFDSGTQAAGMYFLKIETSNSQSMKRVIIGQ